MPRPRRTATPREIDIEAFNTIAEISITLAGFVGIIVILQKGHRGFTEIALVSILVNTVGTALFAFLPDVLSNVVSDTLSWRVSCLIYGIYHIYFMLRHLSLAQKFREMSIGLLGMVVGSVVSILLKLSIAAGFLLEWAYVIYYAALIWSLCIAVFFFVTLLLEANAEAGVDGDA